MKLIQFLAFTLLISSVCWAKFSVRFNSSPKTIGMGTSYIVTVQITSDKKLKNISKPKVIDKPNHMNLITEKSESFSSKMSWTNGNLTQSKDYIYNFTLQFNTSKIGLYNIGPILFEHEETKKTFGPVKIKVIHKKQALRVKETYSKKATFVGEQIRYTLRLILGKNILNVQIPNFKTTMDKRLYLLNLDSTIERKNVYIDGIQTSVADVELTLFPLTDGIITIPPLRIQYQEANLSRQSFFGRAQTTKTTSTSQAVIRVKKLPIPEPPSFLGGVGQYSISTHIDKQTLNQGDVITYTVQIIGSGNPQNQIPPKINIPNFEIFEPEVSSHQKMQGNRLITTQTYSYVLIPNQTKKQEIPALKYTFFNPNTKKYQTIKSSPHRINVLQGKNKPSLRKLRKKSNQKRIETVSEDIQYIKINTQTPLRKKQYPISSQTHFWLILLLPVFIFAIFSTIQKFKLNHFKNSTQYKKNKALEIAEKKLSVLENQQKKHSTTDYHKSLLGIFENFIFDRFQVNWKGLTQQSFKNYLQTLSCNDSVIESLEKLIQEIDLNRFSKNINSKINLQMSTQILRSILQNLNQL